jgi:hypothetical protein
MSEGAQIVARWREAKRDAGYKSVQLWFPVEFLGELAALAYRHTNDHSISSYIMGLVKQSPPQEEVVSDVEMLTCGEKHQYAHKKGTKKRGCPVCARMRKRRQRARENPLA